MQSFDENRREFKQQQQEKAEQARLAGDVERAEQIEQNAKLINLGLALTTLDMNQLGRLPTEVRMAYAVDGTKQVVDNLKDYLNNPDKHKLNYQEMIPAFGASNEYVASEVSKHKYCQEQSNPQVCMDNINNAHINPKVQQWALGLDKYFSSVKETTKAGANVEGELGGTAIVGIGFRQNTGMAKDITGKRCQTYTTCGLFGPMVGGFTHMGGSVSTGTLTPSSRVWQLGYVTNISLGVGGGHGGTINSDGSFTYGGEGSVGGAIGGAIMICNKKVDKTCK